MRVLKEHTSWTGEDEEGNPVPLPKLPKRFTRRKRKAYTKELIDGKLTAYLKNLVIIFSV